MNIILCKSPSDKRIRAISTLLICVGVLVICEACSGSSGRGDGGFDGGGFDASADDSGVIDASAGDRGVDDAGPDPECGDGIVQGDELCEPSTFDAPCSDYLPGVDGAAGCTAQCTLDLSGCTPEGVCGDGAIDAGEDCDDGNADDGDGCSADCQDELIDDCDDDDGDGFGAAEHPNCAMSGVDCDDRAADVHPGASEQCDGRDEDCDGAVDEDVDASAAPIQDRCPEVGVCADGAVNRCEGGRWICDLPDEWLETECPGIKADCPIGAMDDARCDDGVDNDCDGEIDENSPQAACSAHPDFEALANGEPCFNSPDGVCGQQGGEYACVQLQDVCGVDIVCVGAARPEAERCERLDWDCDGHVANRNDRDGDGFGDCDLRLDCDEGDPAVHPGAAEICNGRDDDCDGRTDEGVLNACGACGPVPAEACNGRDDNCNGVVDDVEPAL